MHGSFIKTVAQIIQNNGIEVAIDLKPGERHYLTKKDGKEKLAMVVDLITKTLEMYPAGLEFSDDLQKSIYTLFFRNNFHISFERCR